MTGIIYATLVVAIVGIIIGVALVIANKIFAVATDERVAEVREALPGNNCGACGFAGCDAMAAAIAAGEVPTNACPVCNAERVAKISEIMGTSAGDVEKKVAFVKCSGSCDVTSARCNYVGIDDCRSAVLSGISVPNCSYGCLGYGSCVKACAFGAIKVVNGVALVDPEKCTGCGGCAKACPKSLIELVPYDNQLAVRCSNRDRGPAVKKVCTAGCIGCRLCTKQCPNGAITVTDNIAHINYVTCQNCGKCAEKCPQKVITWMHGQPVVLDSGEEAV